MKYVNVINFRCKDCNSKEYDCISFDPVIVVCSKCGKQINENEFKIEIQEVEE